ncbi:hypothetical protein YPPY12_1794, partial [Yersinia pestis PY-12]
MKKPPISNTAMAGS